MRKIKLYIAMSLNGKIARPDGDVEWLEALPNPENTDHGYAAFYESIDTTIQGYSTYAYIRDRGFEMPTKDKTNYVITRNPNRPPDENVNYITEDPVDFIRQLKQQAGGDIWLIGGGQINTLLFNAGLIDEMQVFVIPIVLPEGIEVFGPLPDEKRLTLVDTVTYSTGAVELKYRVE